MTYAKGYYDSMYGRIESRWEKTGATCQDRFVVPANTTATLYLPAQQERNVAEGGSEPPKYRVSNFCAWQMARRYMR